MSNKEQNNVNDISDQEDAGIDLASLLATLQGNKWFIIIGTVIALLMGFAKVFIDTPIYKTEAMLQIHKQSKSSLLSGLTANDNMDIMGSDYTLLEEIQILKSRRILGKVAKNLNLNITAKPKYFPRIGEAIARRFKNNGTQQFAEPLFGKVQYAWGGEDIHVDNFTVPSSWQGKVFTLIADKHNYFQLFNDNTLILEGQVNKIAQKTLPGESEPIKLFVSLLKARPGTQFEVISQSEISAVNMLRGAFSATEKIKWGNIMELTAESSSPELAVRILNEIANMYVQQNVEEKSAEAQKTLEFLDQQLPKLKEQLEISTSALNEFRSSKGSLDLEQETQGVLTGVVELRTQITLLQQKRDELLQHFTISHPSVIALDKQITRLQQQMDDYEKKIEALPETQKVILRLSRDVQVNTELYTQLLNSAQTIRVSKEGTVGDVRIIDYATLPATQIKPQKNVILGTALGMGLLLSIGIVWLRKALQHGIEDPDIIEKQLNIPIYATIPFSDAQKNIENQIKSYKNKGALKSYQPLLLATENPEDLAIESLRSLRTALHFSFLEAANNIIMITSPSPGCGKSFISINFAVVLAGTSKKVLLMDVDLRRGHLHKELGGRRENGLSELISQSILLSEAIRPIAQGNFDFISTGELPPNPSEVLSQNRFSVLLETLKAQYDYIILDVPPILAVTDAAIIGRLAAASLMVVRSGMHNMRELEQAVKRLTQAKVSTKGIVFNAATMASFNYRRGGRYIYQYKYTQEK